MVLNARSPMIMAGAVVTACLVLAGAVGSAVAKSPAELAGTWDLSFGKSGAATPGAVCRIQLRADRSDKGDYFLGMPPACRHAMPGIATVGRWALPDETHLTLDDPGGQALLTLAAAGSGFELLRPDGTFAMKPIAAGRSAANPSPTNTSAGAFETVTPVVAPAMVAVAGPDGATPSISEPTKPTVRRGRAEASESMTDLAGRYAVMRDKRDTGCMITLDRTRGRGGDRAQLAPGCRDQGIVVFDPSTWQLVRGDLVLTARAGHKTKLEKHDDGVWAKDPKEGGKPLGLKKL